ncbi:hypothetical protein B0186_07655 [Canicola haemoglobinophilus]|uniref:Heme/hemopexin-binding protein B, hemolysin activation/secretion protein n=1 Tax=Canicola haemoglobinophilus TaxID=733 RepID=A0A1V4B072_9PAST|nr:ShlB/FhaC/HecB family hemolysin secretion/activation protein [Canicola haemoglobinophilus]OOR99488.1 hypothetical protein B0186_07655 [Canicola haemoglobinophilus]STO59732.1 heme/hemopexin-binding protein B, hemolysin activation/secretion protein [Canicola haemoglobinophilus]
MKIDLKFSLLFTALLNITATNIYAQQVALVAPATKTPVVNAGFLNQELKQQQLQTEKVKPSGELFNNNLQTHASSSQTTVKFILAHIALLDLEGKPIEENLSFLTQHYLNTPISVNDLTQLAEQITQYYRSHNYLVAKAILPPQEIDNGNVYFYVIKGKIGDTEIKNNSKLNSKLVERINNVTFDQAVYVYKDDLEKLALLLNDIQGIEPSLSVKAGKQKETTDFVISLQDSKRFGGYAMFDNQGNKDTGGYRLSTGTYANNLLGYGDELKLDLLGSNNANLFSARLDYSAMIDGYGTRLGVIGNYLNYKLGGNFKALKANGNSNTLGVYISHPSIRTPHFRLNTKVSFNHQNLADKQSAVGLVQKRKVNSIGLGVYGSWRSVENGVSYFSATINFGHQNNHTNEQSQYQADNFKPKQSFTVFNYTFSHEQSLPKSFALNLSLNGQFSDKNLDSSQKMLLGGLYGVRGYQSGVASVDKGHILQTEIKHYLPLFKESILTTSAFYDAGFGSYYKDTKSLDDSVDNSVSLQSIGLGFNLSVVNNYSLNFIWATPVGKKLKNTDNNQFWLSLVKTF